ncbi:MAG: hypothetical protein L0Y58_08660 [Verrucomicrobia subdivision 3 bacterium]|nr:hypothetical protein [Limisphaerales bacterium]
MANWLGPALKASLICFLLGGSAVGYVLQKNKLHELGRQIARREMVLERLRWENKLRATQLANLQLPQRIEERVRRQNLGLAQAPSVQMIWLQEPLPEPATNDAAALIVFDEDFRRLNE